MDTNINQLNSILNRKKVVEYAYQDIRVFIREIPSVIKENIAVHIASLNNIEDAKQSFALIINQISDKTAGMLNSIWEPFAREINNCHVCCPASLFDIYSFSRLYNYSCLDLKQRVADIADLIPNQFSFFNNQIDQNYIIDSIAEQCTTIFKPICDHLHHLTNSFYDEAIHYLDGEIAHLDGEIAHLSPCLSMIRETLVSYQPQHDLLKKDSTQLQSDRGVAPAIGALVGGVLGAVGRYIFGTGKKTKGNEISFDKVDSAVYAPAEAVKGDDILVQVYIYLPSEVSLVSMLASQVDPDATRRNYIPLTQLLKQGDKIKIAIKSYGGEVLEEPLFETQWNRSLIKHEFVVSIPDDFRKSSLLNSIIIFVNDVPIGEMKFKIRIVDSCPRTLWSEVHSKKYKKSFISYSHDDVDRIRFLAEGFKIQGVDYFFDEHSLRTGDNYPKEIDQYISNCDVFVLCWSENAMKSDWVKRESQLALQRYDNDDNSIMIYPISIVPKADLPPSLSDKFHFGHIE